MQSHLPVNGYKNENNNLLNRHRPIQIRQVEQIQTDPKKENWADTDRSKSGKLSRHRHKVQFLGQRRFAPDLNTD